MTHNDGIWCIKGIKHNLKMFWTKKVPCIHRVYIKILRKWPKIGQNMGWRFLKLPESFQKTNKHINIYKYISNIYYYIIILLLDIFFECLSWFFLTGSLFTASMWPFLRVQETPPPNPVDFLFLFSLQYIKLY
jgi:hypothetical protein